MQRKMKEERKEDIDDKPSFYRIMFPLPDISQQLQIPLDFIKHIDKGAFAKAMFRGPSGRGWPVKLYKSKKGVFVKDGWNRFVEDHSLGHFEFLIFIYDGQKSFDVRIFNKNGLERVVPTVDDASNGSSSSEHFSEDKNKRENERAYDAPPRGEDVHINRRKGGRPRKNSLPNSQSSFSPQGKET